MIRPGRKITVIDCHIWQVNHVEKLNLQVKFGLTIFS